MVRGGRKFCVVMAIDSPASSAVPGQDSPDVRRELPRHLDDGVHSRDDEREVDVTWDAMKRHAQTSARRPRCRKADVDLVSTEP